MLERTTIFALLCPLFLGSFACGDDTPTSTDAGTDASRDARFFTDASWDASATIDSAADASLEPIAEGAFAALFADAYCKAVKPCCDESSTYKPGCVATVTTEVQATLDSMDEGQSYDASQARLCVAALDGLPNTCVAAFEGRYNVLSACQRAINGTVQPGDRCEMLTDCAAPPGAIGSRQHGYVGCLGFEDDITRCRYFEPVGLNQACSDTVLGGSAGVVASCTPDLFCDPEEMTCKPLPSIGEPCMRVGNSAPCGEGFCHQETNLCTALLASGEDCTNSLSCDPCGGDPDCDTRYHCKEEVCQQDNLLRFFSVTFGHIRTIFVSNACDEQSAG